MKNNYSAKNKRKSLPKGKTKKSRIWLFRIILISISLLILVLIEMTLRLTGYGHNYDLFVQSKQYPECYVMNDYASEKFFMGADKGTIGYYEPFLKKKTENTYRIFVLGESTTVGFPYGFNGSFHRWLKYRLMFTFPDVNFEIINLSLTAVNSYTIADFAEKIVDYEPDAVLIYVGHNEYYGALGVGSTTKIGSNPKLVRCIIKLRQLKLYQLINNIIRSFSSGDEDGKLTKKSLMQNMPADTQIAFESKKYKQAINQFRYNMNRTCDILEKANIPVLISNLVSNEKDLKPFISEKEPENSAVGFYEKAGELYKNENFEEAKKLFENAKEYDMLRFRAPEAINMEIENLTNSYNNVKLVDSKSRFEQASPHGIIGNETLLEHVHPNLFGYALMSDAFFNKMKELKLISNEWSHAMSFEELLKEMPVNEVDSLKGEYQIRFMLNEWPFTSNPMPKSELIKPKTELEKNILKYTVGEMPWNKVQAQLYTSELKNGNLKAALKISEAFALIGPLEEKLQEDVASLCIRVGNKNKAAFYYSKAFRLNKKIVLAQQLGRINTEIDNPEKAFEYYSLLQASDKTNQVYGAISGVLKNIINNKQALSANADNTMVLNQLAADYLQLRAIEPAEKYLTESLRLDSKNKETNQIWQNLIKLKTEKQQKD